MDDRAEHRAEVAPNEPAQFEQRALGAEGRLAVQYAIAQAFAETDELAEVSDLLLRTIARALGWQAASIWVLDDDGATLRCEQVIPRDGPLAAWAEHCAILRLAIGRGLPGRVWATQRAVWIRDTDDEQNFPRREIARQVGLRHGFAFPVTARGAMAAVVELFGAEVSEVDAEQAQFLEAVGHQLGSFIERIDARRVIAQSEATKTGILRAAVDAIVSADVRGRIIEFNEAAEAMFGRTRDEVVGRTIADLLVPADLRDAHVEGLARYLATGEAHILGERVRTRAARADGTTLPVELTVTEGRLEGAPMFTAFIRDIARQQELETARDRFLAILSHELRTPVTAIYGGAKMLARPSLDETARADLLEGIGMEADRLYRMVEDLVVLAHAERDREAVTFEPVQLERVVERVVSEVRTRWPDLEFRVAEPDDRHVVQGDETHIEQLLRNLLSNAAKYAASGRVIDIEIADGAREALVRVLDRGPGFERSEADRLFEIDYRSPLTKSMAQGSGIGLFVARWLVETMGGRIWAVPRPGGGSEFGFALPIVDADSDGVEMRRQPEFVTLRPADA